MGERRNNLTLTSEHAGYKLRRSSNQNRNLLESHCHTSIQPLSWLQVCSFDLTSAVPVLNLSIWNVLFSGFLGNSHSPCLKCGSEKSLFAEHFPTHDGEGLRGREKG